jgi:hypothetical protein
LIDYFTIQKNRVIIAAMKTDNQPDSKYHAYRTNHVRTFLLLIFGLLFFMFLTTGASLNQIEKKVETHFQAEKQEPQQLIQSVKNYSSKLLNNQILTTVFLALMLGTLIRQIVKPVRESLTTLKNSTGICPSTGINVGLSDLPHAIDEALADCVECMKNAPVAVPVEEDQKELPLLPVLKLLCLPAEAALAEICRKLEDDPSSPMELEIRVKDNSLKTSGFVSTKESITLKLPDSPMRVLVQTAGKSTPEIPQENVQAVLLHFCKALSMRQQLL